MEDRRILDLFWSRDREAVGAASARYGAYCAAIARGILPDEGDVEECLNDTWLAAWNAIPPQRPAVLRTFLGRLARNAALDRYRHQRAEKRGGGQLPLVLEELGEIAGGQSPEGALDQKELAGAINDFLAALPKGKRMLFVRRYFYADPVPAAAKRCGMTPAAAAMALSRLRQQLKVHLKERGFDP